MKTNLVFSALDGCVPSDFCAVKGHRRSDIHSISPVAGEKGAKGDEGPKGDRGEVGEYHRKAWLS